MITTLTQLILKAAQKLDPDAFMPLAPFEGKTIALELTQPNVVFLFFVKHHHLTVKVLPFTGSHPNETECHATLKGTPFNFWQMMMAREINAATFAACHITVLGEVGLAQAFSEVFRKFEIDWEGHLSGVVGDTLAHHVGYSLRQSTQLMKTLFHDRIEDISIYLQDDMKVAPSVLLVEGFYQDIMVLRHDVARLEARLARLQETTLSLGPKDL